jgi:hypothetical protein
MLSGKEDRSRAWQERPIERLAAHAESLTNFYMALLGESGVK